MGQDAAADGEADADEDGEAAEGSGAAAEESEAEATEAAGSTEGDDVDPIAAEVEDVIEGRSK